MKDLVSFKGALEEVLSLYHRIGEAEGILGGWLHWDGTPEHMVKLREVTERFLKEGKP